MNGAHTKTEAPFNDLRKERETVDAWPSGQLLATDYK